MNWSFKRRSGSFGAALGYLEQDMQGEREGAVEYVNIAVNPAVEMQATVDASRELKSGRGATNSRPVFHYTLSWHPDDQPTPEHMMEQARATLSLLGLEQHQAVVKEHRDRDHSHVHLVVNLVHPTTGRTASLSHYKLKLDKWAQEYEAARTIRSPRRAARHEGRTMERKTDPDLAKRMADLRKKADAAYKRRAEQKDALWQKFRNDEQTIRDNYQSALDELWKRKPTDRRHEPEAPVLPTRKSELKLWVKAMKMLDPEHRRPHARLNFREALSKIAPKNGRPAANFTRARTNLGGPLEQKREGQEVMLPARNTVAARRYAAAARQTKKQRSDEIRKARDQEIQNSANLYERDKAAMEAAHKSEIAAERQEKIALWREGKQEHIAAARGKAKQEFTEAAKPTEEQVSKAKEMYEAFVAELKARHGYDDKQVAKALRVKADQVAPETWREKTMMEELREINVKLGYPATPDTVEADKPFIGHEAISRFVDRLSQELNMASREASAILESVAQEYWERGEQPDIGHGQSGGRDYQPDETGRFPTWQEKLAEQERAAANDMAEQEQKTGTWRDAANGPDWAAPTPEPGRDRGRTL